MDAAQSTLNQEEKSEPQAVVVRREPEREILKWRAPSRPFKKRDRQYFVTIFAMAGIVSLVLFLIEGIMPVVLVVSLVFLYYVLSTVPPEEIEYKITNKGVKIEDKLTVWQNLARFWFITRTDTDILIFDTFSIPGRLEMVIKPEIKDELKKEISAYIPFEEVPASGVDKVTSWISEKLPGNN